MAKFKEGDRVVIKDRKDWPKPPGYRLAGNEGVIIKFLASQDVMEPFQDYIYVKLEKEAADFSAGNVLVFRSENLKKI